jgi:hypothetical protein
VPLLQRFYLVDEDACLPACHPATSRFDSMKGRKRSANRRQSRIRGPWRIPRRKRTSSQTAAAADLDHVEGYSIQLVELSLMRRFQPAELTELLAYLLYALLDLSAII